MNSENSTKEIAAVKEQVQLEAWRREAEAQRASGLSVKTWGVQNDVSPSGYYHRLCRLREAVCRQIGAEQEAMQVPAQPAMVPIRKEGNRGHKFSARWNDRSYSCCHILLADVVLGYIRLNPITQ